MRVKTGATSLQVTLSAILAGGMVLSCVGSEPASRSNTDAATNERAPAVIRAVPTTDTASAVHYYLFESNLESESPRKLILRMMILAQASAPAIGKTLRAVVDSVRQADSSLVAVRAVLYTGRPVSRNQLTLQASAWVEWVPPEGWDNTTLASSQRIHRTFVYSGYAEWDVHDDTAEGEAENE